MLLALRACALPIALGSLIAGCGLAIDVDPPDPVSGGIDAGMLDADLATNDASPLRDGAAPDAIAPRLDGEPPRDAPAVIDAPLLRDAPDLRDAPIAVDASIGEPCSSSSECGDTEYCKRDRLSCVGPGACAPRPAECPAISDPICGCDWHVYESPCVAARLGIGTMENVSCPPRSAAGEWCTLVPSADPAPGGCARCFDDADCLGSLAPICVGGSCHEGGEGVCAFEPPVGVCYDLRQCDLGESCIGSAIDECPPAQGRCDVR